MAADPYTAFFGGVGQGVGKGLGNAISDAGTTSNTASSATYGTQVGGTGWVINFGSGNVDSDATNKQVSTPPDSQQNMLGTLAGVTPGAAGQGAALLVVALIGAAVVYRMRKGRK